MKNKRFNMKSIGFKLVSSLVLLCLIPLVTVGIFTYNQSKSILERKLQVTSSQALLEINRGLTNYFDGLVALLNFISNSKELSDGNSETLKIEAIEDMLQNAQKSKSDVLNVFYGSEQGDFIFYPKVELSPSFNHKEREWYKAAVEKKGQLVFTAPYIDQATGMVVVSLVKALEAGGKIFGVIGMDIDLTSLSKDMSNIKVGEAGYLFISDKKGVLLSHPKEEIIGTDEASKLSIWNVVASHKSGFAKYNYGGKNKFGVYETNDFTGWKLFATLEESELAKDTNSIRNLVAAVSLIVCLIGIAIAAILSRGISGNVKKLQAAFGRAAAGDLTTTVSIKSKDELSQLGTYFNTMLSNISSLMKNVQQSSGTVLETSTNLASMAEETNASIGEVARAIEEVSQGATLQAQNAQAGAHFVNDLSKELDGISGTAIAMDRISESTRTLATRGLTMMQSLLEKSEETKQAAVGVSQVVAEMNESSVKVNTISDTISNITDQTNLLALNASIEAARAGEAGRGFTVVAEEIRKLAEQSRSSTEEIKKINETINVKAVAAVKAMEQTKETIEEQEKAVSNTHHIFNEISEAVIQLLDKVVNIRNSVTDVSKNKEKVVQQIENISSISQETASASEEVTASTEEITAAMEEFTGYAENLQSLSEKLMSEINKFKL